MSTLSITIQRPGKSPHHFDLAQGVYTLGSDNENKIVLPDPSISWRHAILSYTDDGCFIEDLSSANGTYLDGHRLNGREQVRPGQRVQIGYYVLQLNGGAAEEIKFSDTLPTTHVPAMDESSALEPPVQAESEPPPPPVEPAPPAREEPAGSEPPPAQENFVPPHKAQRQLEESPEAKQRRQIKKQIHDELLERLDLKRMTVSSVGEDELRSRCNETLEEIVGDVRARLPKSIDPAELQREIFNEAVALGPLEDLLSDDLVTEIMVNGHNRVYIEKSGKLTLSDMSFVNDESVEAIIERIVSPIGRRIDESQPYVDARLPDGSRVNAIIPPLAIDGPCITIRKFSKDPFTVADLVGFGSMTWNIANFIDACVKCRKNIIVSGGTGTGKTTVLNVVSSYLPESERILTIEDAAELRLTQDHVIRLEARPPNIEGKGAITIRDLVKNALRMRPDRIVVGECRGSEALDMLQAMNTGHEGSLTTVHANSPRDVISRLETMVMMAGMELPLKAIREQIGSAIQMIIHLTRFPDGTRKVSRITEMCGMEGEKITMQDIFEFDNQGMDDNGKVLGRLRATGSVPTFVQEFALRGLNIDQTIFDPMSEV